MAIFPAIKLELDEIGVICVHFLNVSGCFCYTLLSSRGNVASAFRMEDACNRIPEGHARAELEVIGQHRGFYQTSTQSQDG